MVEMRTELPRFVQELQRQEMERRRQEEEHRRQQEERRRQEEELRRKEQMAAMSVRKVMQQLRMATTLEEYEHYRANLSNVLMQEGHACGSMLSTVRDEAEKVSIQVHERIVLLAKQKEEEERRRQELTVLCADIIKELGELVPTAEALVTKLKEFCTPITAGTTSCDAITTAMAAMSQVHEEAKAACKACTSFLVSKRPMLDEARDIRAGDVAAQQLELQTKIHECLKTLVQSVSEVQAAKGKAERKEKAATLAAKRDALFARYDTNKDSFLNDKEILAYAKGEFQFDFPAAALERLLKLYGADGKGVPKARLSEVKISVGIAREEAASRIRKEEAEKRLKLVEAEKAALQEKLENLGKALEATEGLVAEAEAAIRDLPQEVTQAMAAASADAIREVQVKELAMKSDTTLEAAKASLAKDRDQIAAFEKSEVMEENKTFSQFGLRQFSVKVDFCNARVTRVNLTTLKLCDLKKKQEFLELAELRAEVSTVLQAHYQAAATKSEDFFGSIDKDGDGFIVEAEFVDALKGTGKVPEALDIEKLKRIFVDTAGEKMSKEVFQRLGKIYYKVVSATLLTEGKALEGGVRRLEEGEVFEVETLEEKDDAGVVRVQGLAVKDGARGYATVCSNEGTKFLARGGDLFKALMPAELSESAETEGAAQVRPLRYAELMEVLHFGEKTESGVRIKVKAQCDGAVGWVTWLSPDGRALLQVA